MVRMYHKQHPLLKQQIHLILKPAVDKRESQGPVMSQYGPHYIAQLGRAGLCAK